MPGIGKHIQSLRKQRQLSQVQLGRRSGIKRQYISRLERGKLKNPTLNTLRKIAQGLGVPLENLLLSDVSSHSFQDLLQQSEKIEQKIGFLKDDLHKLHQLLDLMEEGNFDVSVCFTPKHSRATLPSRLSA